MKNDGKALATFALAVLILALLVAIILPSVIKAIRAEQRKECIGNLQMLNSVQTGGGPLANCWAEGDKMDPAKCILYIKGSTLPACPSDGRYILSWVVGGPYPQCTIHGNPLQEIWGDRKLHPGIRLKTETDEEYKKRMDELKNKKE